jgi:hypothetical protein
VILSHHLEYVVIIIIELHSYFRQKNYYNNHIGVV